MRASSVVNRQLTPRPARLRAACHAATSRSRVARSARRRFRHCPASMASSISAMFSQLPCLGCSAALACRSAAWPRPARTPHTATPGCGCSGLSWTSTIRSASGSWTSTRSLLGVRPIDPGAPSADRHLSPASKRLTDQEQVAHPTALVLVVLPGRLPRRERHRRGDLPQQLPAGLVQPDLRAARVIGPGVDPKHVLHPPAATRRRARAGCTSAGSATA
jgi:hypothetical protein